MIDKTKIFSGPDEISESGAPWNDIVQEDFHVIIYKEAYPVSRGHVLFVPKYNTMSILKDAFEDAVRYGRQMIDSGECDGFNIGMNYGAAAGQTVKWPHIHLIPRYANDVEDPIGGVRNVIPGKGNYKKWNQ